MSTVIYNGAQNTTATTYTAATEVAAITVTPQLASADVGQVVGVFGNVVFTAGGTAGTVTVRVRQGNGLGGAVVASWVAGTTVINVNFQVPIDCLDFAPLNIGNSNSAQATYTISLQVAGSAGTGVYASARVVQGGSKN